MRRAAHVGLAVLLALLCLSGCDDTPQLPEDPRLRVALRETEWAR